MFHGSPEGVGSQQADRVDFDRRVRLEFQGTQLSSDGGLLVMRELDDALGLSNLAAAALSDTRCGKDTAASRFDPICSSSRQGRRRRLGEKGLSSSESEAMLKAGTTLLGESWTTRKLFLFDSMFG